MECPLYMDFLYFPWQACLVHIPLFQEDMDHFESLLKEKAVWVAVERLLNVTVMPSAKAEAGGLQVHDQPVQCRKIYHYEKGNNSKGNEKEATG